MSDISPIKEVKEQPDQGVVDSLKHLLGEAEKGLLQEFVLVGRHENNILNASAGDIDDAYLMFGKLMDMALDYRERNIE